MQPLAHQIGHIPDGQQVGAFVQRNAVGPRQPLARVHFPVGSREAEGLQ